MTDMMYCAYQISKPHVSQFMAYNQGNNLLGEDCGVFWIYQQQTLPEITQVK